MDIDESIRDNMKKELHRNQIIENENDYINTINKDYLNINEDKGCLLSELEINLWIGQKVSIRSGHYIGNIAQVLNASYGYVQLNILNNNEKIAKRSYELILLDNDNKITSLSVCRDLYLKRKNNNYTYNSTKINNIINNTNNNDLDNMNKTINNNTIHNNEDKSKNHLKDDPPSSTGSLSSTCTTASSSFTDSIKSENDFDNKIIKENNNNSVTCIDNTFGINNINVNMSKIELNNESSKINSINDNIRSIQPNNEINNKKNKLTKGKNDQEKANISQLDDSFEEGIKRIRKESLTEQLMELQDNALCGKRARRSRGNYGISWLGRHVILDDNKTKGIVKKADRNTCTIEIDYTNNTRIIQKDTLLLCSSKGKNCPPHSHDNSNFNTIHTNGDLNINKSIGLEEKNTKLINDGTSTSNATGQYLYLKNRYKNFQFEGLIGLDAYYANRKRQQMKRFVNKEYKKLKGRPNPTLWKSIINLDCEQNLQKTEQEFIFYSNNNKKRKAIVLPDIPYCSLCGLEMEADDIYCWNNACPRCPVWNENINDTNCIARIPIIPLKKENIRKIQRINHDKKLNETNLSKPICNNNLKNANLNKLEYNEMSLSNTKKNLKDPYSTTNHCHNVPQSMKIYTKKLTETYL